MDKPRSRLAAYQRQGFCHVSQLLELLFAKYGMDNRELQESASMSAIASESVLESAALASSAMPVNATTVAPNGGREQITFLWFQPAELPV